VWSRSAASLSEGKREVVTTWYEDCQKSVTGIHSTERMRALVPPPRTGTPHSDIGCHAKSGLAGLADSGSRRCPTAHSEGPDSSGRWAGQPSNGNKLNLMQMARRLDWGFRSESKVQPVDGHITSAVRFKRLHSTPSIDFTMRFTCGPHQADFKLAGGTPLHNDQASAFRS
jgi:hypothetical protein